MPDRENVISTLEEIKTQTAGIGLDSAVIAHKFIDKIIDLLKKQETQKFFVDESGKITPLPVVIRCKDCKHRGNSKKCIVAFVADKQEFPIFFYDNRGDWFCADGKRKEVK